MNPPPVWLVLAVYAAAYAVITIPRLKWMPLGRPAGALVGASAMVLIRALAPREAWQAIEPTTIVLLLGMMILTAYLDIAGFFRWASARMIAFCRSPITLLHAVIWTAGGLSAFLVNDTVCLLLSPLVLLSCRRAGYPVLPYLFALCMGANVGSVATLAGNPQNMLIGALSGDHYRDFALHLLPVAAGGLVIVSGLLHLFFAGRLRATRGPAGPVEPLPKLRVNLLRITLLVMLGVVAAFLAGSQPASAALIGACVLLVAGRLSPRHVFHRVDWTLLLFFAGLFVVVEGVVRAGVPEWIFHVFSPLLGTSATRQAAVFSVLAVLGSNLVSNVPFILVARPWIGTLQEPLLQWRILAMATTFAGNLTILGSVANLIVLQAAGEEASPGFWGYLRVGLPVTAATTAWGLTVLLLLR